MIKKLLSTIVILLSFSAHSQTVEWLNTSPIDFDMNPDNIGYNIALDPSGNVYMTGFKDDAFIYEDIMGTQFFNKFDPEGNEVFTKEITGNVSIYNIACDNEGNLIMTMGFVQFISIGTLDLISINQGVNYLMVKFDSSGEVVWYHEFFLPDSAVSSARGLAIDSSNNIYVSHDDYMDSYIQKFSPDGDVLFAINQEQVSSISSLDVDDAGNIYAAGSCANTGATFGTVSVPLPEGFTYNTYIAKYSAAGVFQWVKYLDNITCPLPQVVAKSPDAIYLTSELFEAYSFDAIIAEGPTDGFQDTYIAKLNATGNFQWIKEVPGSGSLIAGNRNILTLDDDGNIYFGGITSSTVNWSPTITTTTEGFGNRDAILLKYNPQGDILMAKTFGGSNQDRIDGVALSADGSIFIAGLATGTVDFDGIIIEEDEFERYPFVARFTNETLGIKTPEKPSIAVYPNPASTSIHFLNVPENTAGSIYTILGQKVKDFKKDQQPLAIIDLSEGTYILKFEGYQAIKFVKF